AAPSRGLCKTRGAGPSPGPREGSPEIIGLRRCETARPVGRSSFGARGQTPPGVSPIGGKMKTLWTAASLVALFVLGASAAPAPRTLDHLTRSDVAHGAKKAQSKVSSRMRTAEEVGPLAGPLVPVDPPRSPDGKLLVYVDCAPLGAEQVDALERAG